MRYFKIQQYVSEDVFFENKNNLLHTAAFADCFVIDIHNDTKILAAYRESAWIENPLWKAFALPESEKCALANLFHAKQDSLLLACHRGTLLCFPAWKTIGLALVFLLDADLQTVEKCFKNAQRSVNSPLFEKTETPKTNNGEAIQKQLQTILFYTERLLGKEKEKNVVAQILMIANLAGCKLHKVAVEQISTLIYEREFECFSAYLFCVLLTMRRFSGNISASDNLGKADFSTHVVPEYGLYIQQTAIPQMQKSTKFDTPTKEDVASFLHHPAFTRYQTEEKNGGICLTLPVGYSKTVFSLSTKTLTRAIKITLFQIG